MENHLTPIATVIKRIIVKYALYATATYVIYFILMKMLGLAPHVELRFINYFLYFITGYYALKALTLAKHGQLNYLQGLGVSYAVGALSFILYAVIVFIYSYFDLFFVNTILAEYPSAHVLGRFAPAFAIASEGMGVCTVLSFCLMQYFKIFSRRKRRFFFFRRKTAPEL